MNNKTKDILRLLEKIHSELVKVTAMLDTGNKYQRDQSSHIERIDELVMMQIDGLHRNIAFRKVMVESNCSPPVAV